MNLKENKKLWEERVTAFKASGLTQQEWCNRHQFKQSTLCYWNTKLHKEAMEAEQPLWLAVNVNGDVAQVNTTQTDSPVVATVKIGRFEIEISPEFHAPSLSNLLRILAELC